MSNEKVYFGPKVNLYLLANRKERECVENKTNDHDLLPKLEKFLEDKEDILLQMVYNDSPYKTEIGTLFAKIKQFCKDNSWTEHEKKTIDRAREHSEREKQKDPSLPIPEDYYILTRTQVEQFLKDRIEHLEAEKKQSWPKDL
jgi:hypothetical protein